MMIMKNTVSLKHNLLSDLLEECRLRQDMTVICRDGLHQCSSFLLASILPQLGSVFECSALQEDHLSVSIPDIEVRDIKWLFESILNQNLDIQSNPRTLFLLRWGERRKSSPPDPEPPEKELVKDDDFYIDKVKTELDYEEEEEEFYKDNIFGDQIRSGLDQNEDSEEEEEYKPVKINVRASKSKKLRLKKKDEDWTADYDQMSDEEKTTGTFGGRKKRKYTRKSTKEFKGFQYLRFEYSDLTCRVCEMEFKQEATLYRHVHVEHGPHNEMKCPECAEIFYHPSALDAHKQRVHVEKVPCPECGLMFNKFKLEGHVQTHFDQKLPCDQCGKTFKGPMNLRYHKLRTHEGQAQKDTFSTMNKTQMGAMNDKVCDCGISFSNLQEKVKHFKIVHNGYQECPKCNKVVKDTSELRHNCAPYRKPPPEICVCKICGKQFTGSGGLFYHMNKEHIAQECSCEKCGKRFDNKMSLQSHIRRHCMKEVQQCNLCGVQVRHMKAHMHAVHTRDEDKRHCCEFCGKGFLEKRAVEKHKMNVHLKLRPHRCRYGCDIGYNDTSNRNAHEKKIHGGLFEQRKTAVIS